MTGYDSISTLIELDLKTNLIAASVPEVQKLVMFNRSCHYCTIRIWRCLSWCFVLPVMRLPCPMGHSKTMRISCCSPWLVKLKRWMVPLLKALLQWMFGFSKFQPAPFLKLSAPKIGWWMDGQAMKHDEHLQFGPKNIEPYPRLRVTVTRWWASSQGGIHWWWS